MQVIDYPRFAQRLQAYRVQAGLTIRDLCAKLKDDGVAYSIEPEEWALIEAGESHPTSKFANFIAQAFDIEVPMTEGEDYPAGTYYRCGTLTLEESAELDRLTETLYQFCKSKNVGMYLLLSQDMVRRYTGDGFDEESAGTIRKANVHSLPSAVAPLLHLVTEAKGRADQGEVLSGDDVRFNYLGFKAAHVDLVTRSLEKAPAGDHQLLNFHPGKIAFD